MPSQCIIAHELEVSALKASLSWLLCHFIYSTCISLIAIRTILLLKDAQEKAKKHEDDLELLKKEYNRFKLLLGQTQQGRASQTQNATTFEIISDFESRTRYRRRQETKEKTVDFAASFASKEIIELQKGEVLTGSVWKGC